MSCRMLVNMLIVGLFFSFCSQAIGGAVIWSGDGDPAPIVTSGPLESENEDDRRVKLRAKIVDDLGYHIEMMTGQRPEVIVTEDTEDIPTTAIVLGEPAYRLGAEPQYKTTMEESFRLLTKDGRVLIGGESVYGVSHGVYELLRELGCDWIFPGEEGEVIPQIE